VALAVILFLEVVDRVHLELLIPTPQARQILAAEVAAQVRELPTQAEVVVVVLVVMLKQ
jgi:hypothetical protein